MPTAAHLFFYITVLVLLVSNKALAGDLLELKEQAWLRPKATTNEQLIALTQKPIECLNPNAAPISKLGRLAFESPALLGGQAARMGLSCASCHPSGRANTQFFINNISSTPGTADITHSFFSSTGGNNILTAVAIPDLTELDQVKIKNRWSPEFKNKLRELIEVEFDGQPAPPLIITALQTYLANSDSQYCPTAKDQPEPIRLDNDWARLKENIETLISYSDKAVNNLLIRAARKRLEKIYWRYKNIKNIKIEKGLITLSHYLEESNLNKISHIEQIEKLKGWNKSANKLFANLKEYETLSLYDPNVLESIITETNQARKRNKR